MTWIITVILIIITAGFFAFSAHADWNDWGFLAISSLIIGMICAIISIVMIINAISWTYCVVNIEASQADVQARGTVYAKLLEDYEEILMPNDVTAADSYVELYEKVLSYNNSVRKAEKWDGVWWASGLLYDPAYVGAKTIPINVE